MTNSKNAFICTVLHSTPFHSVSFCSICTPSVQAWMRWTTPMCSEQMMMSWIKCVDLTTNHLKEREKEWEKIIIIIVIMAIALWIWRHATFGIKVCIAIRHQSLSSHSTKIFIFLHRLWLTANATPSYLCVLFISICPHGYAIEWNVIEYIEVIGPSKVCINFKFQCIEKVNRVRDNGTI